MAISTIKSNSLDPASDLVVNGLTVGKGAGAVSTNTAVGASALAANTTGSGNTALGYQTLNASTSNNNTAVGYQAGYSNTTNGRNTFVGYGSGYTNTGGENTAVGYTALNLTSSGQYNTAIGSQALLSNTTSSYNTAVGYQAGYNADRTADIYGYNSLFGYIAGKNISTGQVNVFIGSRSGSNGASAITGSGNTVVGDFAGNLLAGAASNNAFFGQNSGYAITTGSKNTILGSYGGNQGGLDIRTASNYIVLSDGDGNPKLSMAGNFADWRTGDATIGTIQRYYNSSGAKGNICFGASYNQASAGDGIINVLADATYTTPKMFIGAGTSGGVYLSYNATSWTANSDERLKNITGEIQNGLEKVCSLRAAEFTWKSDESAKPQVGLIAQEVEAVLPQVISHSKAIKDDDTEYLGVAYTEVIPLLVAAIKELNAKVEAQAAEIAALKGQA